MRTTGAADAPGALAVPLFSAALFNRGQIIGTSGRTIGLVLVAFILYTVGHHSGR